jgi:hypothetical protein
MAIDIATGKVKVEAIRVASVAAKVGSGDHQWCAIALCVRHRLV